MKKSFREMTTKEQRRFKARQAMIEEAIEKGSFDDRDDLKAWMKREFRIDLPVEEISTEYTLTEKQMKLFYIWLKHFTGKGPRPRHSRPKGKITERQLFRIGELQKELGWIDYKLEKFIERQTGSAQMEADLFKNEATKIITGMEQILADKYNQK